MKLEIIFFERVGVGLQIEAQNAEESELLTCLEGLTAEGNQRKGNETATSLFLCPQLPWKNLKDVKSV